MTNAEIAAYIAGADPGTVRYRARISIKTIADACGTSVSQIWLWENHLRVPRGPAAARYARIIAGLARHLEIPEEPAATGPPARSHR